MLLGLAPVAFLGIFNWHTDALSLFARREATDPSLYPIAAHSRATKPMHWILHPSSSLILGSSRAEIGLPATGDPWGPAGAFNLAMGAQTPHETRLLLEHAADTRALEQVVISLDLPTHIRAEFDHGLSDRHLLRTAEPRWSELIRIPFGYVFPLLVSRATAKAALCDLVEGDAPVQRRDLNGTPLPTRVWDHASHPAGLFTAWVVQELKYVDLWREFAAMPHELQERRLNMHLAETASSMHFARRHQLPVTFVILPVHPLHLVMLEDAGAWEIHTRWLARLVHAAESADVPLVDFTNMAWLKSASPAELDTNFVDTSHVSAEFGRRLLREVVEPVNQNAFSPRALKSTMQAVTEQETLDLIETYRNRLDPKNRALVAQPHALAHWVPPLPQPQSWQCRALTAL